MVKIAEEFKKEEIIIRYIEVILGDAFNLNLGEKMLLSIFEIVELTGLDFS